MVNEVQRVLMYVLLFLVILAIAFVLISESHGIGIEEIAAFGQQFELGFVAIGPVNTENKAVSCAVSDSQTNYIIKFGIDQDIAFLYKEKGVINVVPVLNFVGYSKTVDSSESKFVGYLVKGITKNGDDKIIFNNQKAQDRLTFSMPADFSKDFRPLADETNNVETTASTNKNADNKTNEQLFAITFWKAHMCIDNFFGDSNYVRQCEAGQTRDKDGCGSLHDLIAECGDNYLGSDDIKATLSEEDCHCEVMERNTCLESSICYYKYALDSQSVQKCFFCGSDMKCSSFTSDKYQCRQCGDCYYAVTGICMDCPQDRSCNKLDIYNCNDCSQKTDGTSRCTWSEKCVSTMSSDGKLVLDGIMKFNDDQGAVYYMKFDDVDTVMTSDNVDLILSRNPDVSDPFTKYPNSGKCNFDDVPIGTSGKHEICDSNKDGKDDVRINITTETVQTINETTYIKFNIRSVRQ